MKLQGAICRQRHIETLVEEIREWMGRIAGQKEGFVTEGGHGYPLLGQVPKVLKHW